MKKITILFAILTFAFNVANAQTIFDFESATGGSGDDITETKDDITLTLTGSPTLGIGTGGSFGSTGQIVR
ncbi:hypothetical protein Q4Q35_09490, partial [Flavivirga aquimarina]